MQENLRGQNSETKARKRAEKAQEIDLGKRTGKSMKQGFFPVLFMASFCRIFQESVFSYRKNKRFEYLCYFKNLFTVCSESHVIINKNQI